MAEGEAPAEPAPEGCMSLFIPLKGMHKYGLKEEEADLTDTVPYMMFNKAKILEEIDAMGFMCDFQPAKAELEKFTGEEFMAIADPEEKYGTNWYVALTVEAIDREMAVFKEAELKIEAERKAAEEEAARIAAEEEARRNVVYEDKPMYAQPYFSESGDVTYYDVRELGIIPERPLVGTVVTRPRISFGQHVVFDSKDSDGPMEFRSQKNPDFDNDIKERDVGLQGPTSTLVNHATQTTWFRPVNKAVQYDAIQMETEAAADHLTNSALSSFLKGTLGSMEEALQQNETVNIFRDAFARVGDDDAAVGQKGDNDLKELRTFRDVHFSKGQCIAAIDWHPKRMGMVAVSPARNIEFDERVQKSGQAFNAYILFWDFMELIDPAVVLQSPHEMMCFRFNGNPGCDHFVAAGCINGQVILWDTSDAMKILDKKNRGGRRDKDEEEEDEDTIPPVQPLAVSQIDFSHRRMVADLVWLPPNTQVNLKGQLLDDEHLDGKSYQFMTLSGDGQCLVWDIRFAEIAEGNLPWIAKPRHAATSEKKGDKEAAPKWLPLFRMQLKRLEGVGELSLCRLSLSDPTLAAGSQDQRSQIFCSSEEGEIVFADWRARPAGAKDDGKGDEGGDDHQETPEYVQWMAQDHSRPCVGLERSPFFPDLMLSVGDWNFQIWKRDSQVPIFSSPQASTYLTTGRWSPTKPGMLFVAKQDGGVDVWDLTDSSYKPSTTLMVCPSLITSMEFLTGSLATTRNQLLSVGDVAGNLHVFDMPRNLWRQQPNEKNLMTNFIEREGNRVQYVMQRAEVRRAEVAAMGGGEDDMGMDVAETKAPGTAGPEEDLDALPNAEEAAEEEAKYQELEKKFIEDLGLEIDELPELWRKTHADELAEKEEAQQ